MLYLSDSAICDIRKLKQAMEILQKEERYSVMPVTAFSFPPLRGMVQHEGKITYKWPEYAMKRSQDIEEIYHDCGQFYAFQVDQFQKREDSWQITQQGL